MQAGDCIKICMETRRDVFQAIADPTRREIIGLIAGKAMTPNAVADSFRVSRQAISNHIRILTECGLLTVAVRGREHYYSIQPRKLETVYNWLSQYRQLWEDRLEAMDGLLQELQTNPPPPSKARTKNKK